MLCMRLIANIDVLDDELLLGRIMRTSFALLAGGAAITLFLALLCEVGLGLVWWLWLCFLSVAALPVHELVHGAAFKLFVPGCRVSFGWQGAFLYTSANGAVMRRRSALLVLLAPAVVVTCALVLLGLSLSGPALAAALAFFHLAGCTGDLAMVREILREPACTHVRDTDLGIDLLSAFSDSELSE